ncbi:MAG: hypothetical protein QOF77_448 [Solirubrobacteraceae bacterium]|nr:hypothetical protein [Solirubrobacteraceae bacterium]
MRNSRRVVISFLASVLALGGWLVAASPGGATDFGTRSLQADRYGGVVSLSTPSSRLFQEADEFVVHRDVVQSLTDRPGLAQVGVYRSGPQIQLDNCGTSAGYVVFTEVLFAGSMSYRCQLIRPVSPTTILNLDIFRFTTPGAWGIRVNGVPAGSAYQLGFDRGAPAIGSELQDVDSNNGTHTATRFSLAGHTQWNVYTTTGRSHPHRVGAGDATFLYTPRDPFWTVPRPPTTMTIRHR